MTISSDSSVDIRADCSWRESGRIDTMTNEILNLWHRAKHARMN